MGFYTKYYYGEDTFIPIGVILNPKTNKPYGVAVSIEEDEDEDEDEDEEGKTDREVIITHLVSGNALRGGLDVLGAGYFDKEVGVRGEPREQFRDNPDDPHWATEKPLKKKPRLAARGCLDRYRDTFPLGVASGINQGFRTILKRNGQGVGGRVVGELGQNFTNRLELRLAFRFGDPFQGRFMHDGKRQRGAGTYQNESQYQLQG